MIEFQAAVFVWFMCSFEPPSRALVAYHLDIDEMPLRYAIGVNFKKGATIGIKAQLPSIWAMGECWMILRE